MPGGAWSHKHTIFVENVSHELHQFLEFLFGQFVKFVAKLEIFIRTIRETWQYILSANGNAYLDLTPHDAHGIGRDVHHRREGERFPRV